MPDVTHDEKKPAKRPVSTVANLYDKILTKEAQAQIAALQKTLENQFKDGFTRAELHNDITKVVSIVMNDFDKTDGLKDGIVHKDAILKKLNIVLKHPSFAGMFEGEGGEKRKEEFDRKIGGLPDVVAVDVAVTEISDVLKKAGDKYFNMLDVNHNSVVDDNDFKTIGNRIAELMSVFRKNGHISGGRKAQQTDATENRLPAPAPKKAPAHKPSIQH